MTVGTVRSAAGVPCTSFIQAPPGQDLEVLLQIPVPAEPGDSVA